ncbi:MAG TPA: phosphoribosylamine--glycine ligase [Candidatus Polarisedimenticolaceae bacterium]|nr:phosphoribosylamine--glycine ligase [Candidatus Polarisedimenticolaceae bacterium]
MAAPLKVLIVGSGGREDALAWALRRSPEVGLLRCAPGNPGTDRRAESVPIPASDVPALVRHAEGEPYDLVVVGPEAPLVGGLADRLRAAGIAVFGPDAGAAELEGSKVFAKRFMARHGIPTAAFTVFEDEAEASRFLLSEEASYPLVVKADGLAGGKGVVVAEDPESAVEVARAMLGGRAFGSAGARIVVEERLVGHEASFFVLSDGVRCLDLAVCQDYKRAEDGDRGPNTGGMGAYSPSAWLDENTRRSLLHGVARRTIEGLAAEGRPYRGVLFVGVMLTASGPRVLEYNVRFGDPETQVLLPRLQTDWLPLLLGAARGDLSGAEVRWKEAAAVCVVLAARGYPGSHATGYGIEGIEEAERVEGVEVFHAGTERERGGRIVGVGGRVLDVVALGDSLAQARERAYRGVARIHSEGLRHREDIAADALAAAEGPAGV